MNKIKTIATNLPGFVIHEPILSLEDSSGNDDKSTFCNFDIVSKFTCSGLKSPICELMSLILPSLSNAAGFSLPFCPTLNNFMFFLF
ncbi:hypothetical protein OAL94_01820 [Candidatus Pelagibacter sp.]|nr:hypothetical protein [Candidatus Pelagibacter sp.]